MQNLPGDLLHFHLSLFKTQIYFPICSLNMLQKKIAKKWGVKLRNFLGIKIFRNNCLKKENTINVSCKTFILPGPFNEESAKNQHTISTDSSLNGPSKMNVLHKTLVIIFFSECIHGMYCHIKHQFYVFYGKT